MTTAPEFTPPAAPEQVKAPRQKQVKSAGFDESWLAIPAQAVIKVHEDEYVLPPMQPAGVDYANLALAEYEILAKTALDDCEAALAKVYAERSRKLAKAMEQSGLAKVLEHATVKPKAVHGAPKTRRVTGRAKTRKGGVVSMAEYRRVTAECRAWLKEHDEIGDKGRIPGDKIAKWEKVTGRKMPVL